MNKDSFTTLFYCLLCSLFFLFSASHSCAFMVGSDESEVEEVNVEESIEFSSPPVSPDVINFDIFEDIARARELLDGKRCGFQVVKSKKGKGKKKEKVELGEFTILLAIENVKTREIQVVRVHPKFGAKSNGLVIEPGKSNGVNTKFTITYPEHHIVLAIKRPVRQGNIFREVIYTPYSEGLDIPQVTKAGLEYLKHTLSMAKKELIRRRVRSLSGEGFVEDDVSLALAIIEHIDPLKFESGKYTEEKLIHETLVIIGTNRENAYRYSVSKAGARGLFQFIPKTYQRMVRLYPGAALYKDFARGMENHTNAAKASFLLFDADMHVLKNGGKEQFMAEAQVSGRFLASAYNCGSGRTKKAMDRYGEQWFSGGPAETQVYLRKFDAVWQWLRLQPETLQEAGVLSGRPAS